MATAKKVQVPQPKYEVVLTLSEEEAEVLFFLTGKVGGSPQKSPRAVTESIHRVLCDLGVPYRSYNLSSEYHGFYFADDNKWRGLDSPDEAS